MTHILEMFDPSEYVAAFELDGKDVTATIARVVAGEVIGEDGAKARKPIVYFSDWPKPLVLGKKMARVLIKLYGTTEPRAYVGKQLTMYPTTEKCFGEMRDVVRIRPTVRKTAAAPKTEPERPVGERVSLLKAELRKCNTREEVEKIRNHARAKAIRTELAADELALNDLDMAYESRLNEIEHIAE